jgi:hypothetical protein
MAFAEWRSARVILDGAFLCSRACFRTSRKPGRIDRQHRGETGHRAPPGRAHVVTAKAGSPA